MEFPIVSLARAQPMFGGALRARVWKLSLMVPSMLRRSASGCDCSYPPNPDTRFAAFGAGKIPLSSDWTIFHNEEQMAAYACDGMESQYTSSPSGWLSAGSL